MNETELGADEGAGESGRAIADGIVMELLPSQLAKVSLEGRHLVTVHLGNPVQRNYIRVLVGDRVRVALMPADKTRGRIVEKL
jgi:translation initiation factor IF-1